MAYFSRNQGLIERRAKIAADIFCGMSLAAMAIAAFGWLVGLPAFVILEAELLSVDYLVPNEDDATGAVVR